MVSPIEPCLWCCCPPDRYDGHCCEDYEARPGQYEIELVSGRYLDLLKPDPSVITLDVIAHGLSNICRYTGQSRCFYSVAEHACLVASWLKERGYSPSYQLAGLHHDDHEAFASDISRPLRLLLRPAYDKICDRLDAAIAVALSIPPLVEESDVAVAVKTADYWALSAEAYHLMPSKGRGWWCDGLYDPTDERLTGAGLGESPGWAYETFRCLHQDLRRQIEGSR